MDHRIVELRRQRGMSQTALAECVGATLSMIGKLERGERTLTVEWLEKIATCLAVEPLDLLADLSRAPVHVGHIDASGRIVEDNDYAMSVNLNSNEVIEVDFDKADRTGSTRSVGVNEDKSIILPAHSRLIYDAPVIKPTKGTIGRLCVAWVVPRLAAKSRQYEHYVATLLPGTVKGCYHVLPLGGALLANAEVPYVAMIQRIELADR